MNTALISSPRQFLAGALILAIILSGCTVGPHYHRPDATVPESFKELTPADYQNTDWLESGAAERFRLERQMVGNI